MRPSPPAPLPGGEGSRKEEGKGFSVTGWQSKLWPAIVALCAALLLCAGLAGIARGDVLAQSTLQFFPKQLMWIALALPAFLIPMCIHYRPLRQWSYGLYAVSLVLLCVVFFCPPKNGARGWIPLGFADFQPSELMKLALVLTLAHYLMYSRNHRTLLGLVPPFLLTLIPVVLILREPDLGTALLFFPVLFGMLFAAGAKWKSLLIVVLMGIVSLPVVWTCMNAEQRSRVTVLFQQADGVSLSGDDYQLHQAKQMLALGGLWGSDISGSAIEDQRAYHLPASRSDFVFCLVGERWGLMGCLAVLVTYLVLIASGLAIAANTEEPFGRLVATGVTVLLGTQVVVNMGVTVGLMPITGITLPLMSAGGSSLLTIATSLGLLASIGRRPDYELAGDPFRYREPAAS